MMTLVQVECFVAVAEEGHFGRAAERLSMTQPPLSRHIQALEREVGAELVDRSHRAIRLTEAGKVFLREARALLSGAESAAHLARRTARGIQGSLQLGFTSAVGHAALPWVLGRLTDAVPDVVPTLHEMVTDRQLDAVASGAIDLGMVRDTTPTPGLAFRSLPPDRLAIAAPRQWGLAGDDASLSALHGRDFVMYSTDASRYFHDMLRAIFTARGVAPRYRQHVAQIPTMLTLVDAGLGAALVPASTAAWAGPRTTIVHAPELDTFPIESSLVWRTDSENPVLERVLDALAPSTLPNG